MDQKCSYCGAPLEGYETFCPECGRDLSAKAPADETYVAPLPEDPADWFTVHDDDDVPQFRRSAVRKKREPAATAEYAPAEEPAALTEPEAEPLPDLEEESAEPAYSYDSEEAYAEPAYRYTQTAPQAEDTAPSVHRPARRAPAAPQHRRPAQRSSRPAGRAPQRRPVQQAQAKAQPLEPRQRMMLLIGMGVLLLVLIIGGARMLFGGDDRVVYPFTPVVDRYFTAVRTANANTYIATRPEAYTEYLTTGSGRAYDNESDYRAQTAASLHERLAQYQAQFGTIRVIDYSLRTVTNYAHRCEALNEVLTGWYSFPENSVSDAYIVNGIYTVRGDNGAADYNITDLLLIKIGNEWYFSPDAGSYWRAE